MNRRGFFGALASVCGAAAGAAVAIALPAPKPKPPIFSFVHRGRVVAWRNYSAPYQPVSQAEMATLMRRHILPLKGNLEVLGGSPYGIPYWLTKR